MSRSAELDLHLHPKQGEALNTVATEVLYGGAAGGGKSHLMRIAAIIWCSIIPGLQVYIFRRIREDLIKNHMEGPKGFRALLALWSALGFVSIVEDEIRFWNGSKIYLCHCKDAKDVYKYQGAEIHVLLIDELTHFTEAMYRYLRSRVRMVGLVLPPDYAGKFPRILCGSNPGNVGHLWVKQFWIEDAQPFDLRLMPEVEGGMLRQFIPALLDDNPSMGADDPGYESKLAGLGSEALVRAMRYGDWDIIEGAFFDCWDRMRHVIEPMALPDHLHRFRSGDWGSAKPFSFGWWAVASDPIIATVWGTNRSLKLPRGCMIRYREWYGKKTPNVGLKLTAEEVGRGIAERQKGDPKADSILGALDPSAFAEDGGPSIAERMGTASKIYWTRADNKRVARDGAMGGWDQMRARLKGDADGNPMIVCFSTCADSIRTIPVLQHDSDRPEDLDTEGEDHAADDWRYGCMSRPWVVNSPVPARKSGRDYVSRESTDYGDMITL
jgi:hypothetical protein